MTLSACISQNTVIVTDVNWLASTVPKILPANSATKKPTTSGLAKVATAVPL
jgi:hypothetical protein